MLALSSSCTLRWGRTLYHLHRLVTRLSRKRATLMNSENSGRGIPYLASISRLVWSAIGTFNLLFQGQIGNSVNSWMTSLICPPMLYSLFKSFPNNSLMAMSSLLYRESMASIRWEIGWPISMFTPFSSPSRWRTSAKNSSGTFIQFERLPFLKRLLQGRVHPILHVRFCGPLFVFPECPEESSAIRPILSDSSRKLPAWYWCRSWVILHEWGRKLRPNPVMMKQSWR